MLKTHKINDNAELTIYNNILVLSRNKLFYTKFDLADTFQNRIHLIFMHISFLFIKIKQNNDKKIYTTFYQKIFDLIFNKIELNMREIGYGDVVVNKNMKLLVKSFFNILLSCENFKDKNLASKNTFFDKYLNRIDNEKKGYNTHLIDYFNKYYVFCFDLSSDSVLKGNLKFNYK